MKDTTWVTTSRQVGRWTRRAFLAALGLLGAARWLPVRAARNGLAFKPAVFDADTTGVIVWLSAEEALEATIEVSASADYRDAIRVPASLKADTDFTLGVPVTGLSPGIAHHYRVLGPKGVELFAGGRFRTAPTGGARFTVAFTGDMGAEFMPFKLLDVIAGMNPHLFLHLGDTVYADRPKKEFSPSVRHYRK